MAFPPKKKPDGGGSPKPKPKPTPNPKASPGPAGPPMGPPGGAPVGGPPPMPMPPMPMGPPPGAPADPTAAMLGMLGPGGMGASPPPPPPFPAGPNGLPFGAGMPSDFDGDEGPPPDSPLLAGLMAAVPNADPYAPSPGDLAAINQGTADPNLGMEQLLQLLALAQMGVGGGPPPMSGVAPGGSGAPYEPAGFGKVAGY